MKNLYAFSLALILVFPAQAGNWDLFPLGNATYYADSTQQPVTVELFRIDSILPGGVEDVLFFNLRSRSQMLGSCAATLQDPYTYLNGYPLTRDSLIQRQDTVFYNSEFSTLPFYFLPQASIGQSWSVTSDYSGNSFNQITLTCTGIEQRTFMGVTDSVKVFSLVPSGTYPGQTPISDFQIVLSKAHGLVEFVPFGQFIFHPNYIDFRVLKMVGLQDGVNDTGFHAPEFTDYFHLHAGDVLFWELHNLPPDISYPETYEYRKDSITSTISTPDSVIYYAHRISHHWDGTITQWDGISARYYRSNFEALINAGTNALAYTGNVNMPAQFPIENFQNAVLLASSYTSSMANNGLESFTELEFSWGGHYWDTTLCEVNQVADAGYEYRIDTRAGCTLWRMLSSYPAEYAWRLIGSIINGVEDGDITLGINQPGSISQQAFTLAPNPAKQSISFQGLPAGATGQFTIYDGLGREAMHGTLPTAALSVEGLQTGVYVVQVRFSDRIEMARFVKE